MGKKSKNSRKIARRGNPDLAQRNPLTSIVKQLEGSLSHDNNELMLYSKVIKKVLAKFPKKGEAVPQCHHHSLGIVHPMDKNEVFWYLLLKQMQNDCNILPNIIKTCDYDMEDLVDDANFLLLHETWALAEHARQSPCERHSAGIKGVILTVATELYLKFEYDAVKYFLVDLVSFYARIDELHEPTVNLNDFTLHQLELAFVHAEHKVLDIIATEYSLVKFIHKRLPCDCLKQHVKRLKKAPRTTLCLNVDCKKSALLPDDMMFCGNCSRIWYCSPVCQADDWPRHQQACETLKYANADYDTAFMGKIALAIMAVFLAWYFYPAYCGFLGFCDEESPVV